MKYNFTEIERKWQKYWEENKTFKAEIDHSKPKFYCLDFFPYPSGEGLHVGHSEGYTATDIMARYKRMKGFNVLHPFGWDAFGLPAEQYAVKTGIHPKITAQESIANFKRQSKAFGFSFDWDREISTIDGRYYKWTQWIFLQLYKRGLAYQAEVPVNWCPELGTVLANEEVSEQLEKGYTVERRPMRQWMLKITEYAERLLQDLDTLNWPESTKEMQKNWIGKSVGARVRFDLTPALSKGEGVLPGYMTTDADTWQTSKEKVKELRKNQTEAEEFLWEHIRNRKLGDKFRRQHAIVNYIVDFVCIEKKLVVEVDGEIHERTKEEDEYRTEILNQAGFRVIRFKNDEVKYKIDYVLERIKEELQKQALSFGEGKGEVEQPLPFGEDSGGVLEIFTTRPDTLWGATYMVLAPEHHFVDLITTDEHKREIEAYRESIKNKTDLERQQLEKEKTGVFTGGYAVNPVNNQEIPVWISDYVLMGYGTGAIMAVPGHDQRDWEFAKKFNLPIVEVVKGGDITKEAYVVDGVSVKSGFISGLKTEDAKKKVIAWLEENKLGEAAVQYRLRDWLFSRQRYWGEPIPVIHLEDGTVKPVDDNDLPVELPDVESYKPAGTGESPLANIPEWVNTIDKETGKPAKRETNTMPQWAGSCWYYLRYLDPHNDKELCNIEKEKYWMPVDLYLGGAEHAVLHLLYARFWHKVLYDAGYVSTPEPFMWLYHQGMILANTYYMHIDYKQKKCLSWDLLNEEQGIDESLKDVVHGFIVPIDYIDKNGNFDLAKIDKFKKEFQQFADFAFVTGKMFGNEVFALGSGIDKMSKSFRNVVDPDEVIAEYGADSLRLFEMFLGPLSAGKPWSTRGIEGVFRFLNRVWRLFINENGYLNPAIQDIEPSGEIETLINKAIKEITQDIEDMDMRFNTCVSELMIFVNEISKYEKIPKSVMETFTKLLSPFAPHLAEELWEKLGHQGTITFEPWPEFDPMKLLKNKVLVVGQVNGKIRTRIEVEPDTDEETLKKIVKNDDKMKKYMDGKQIVKEIVVKNKLVNIVVK